MKKLFTLLFIGICFITNAQTLHKQYSLNYCNMSDCNMNTLIYGGGLYYCYVEDSLMIPSGKQNMVLQKNDLNGVPVWKKVYKLNPSTPISPVKIVSMGANLYIGGTYGAGGFLTRIDTAAGNIGYFTYYPPFGTLTSVAIKDIAIHNNTEIVAVGEAASSASGVYLYVLRANAANGAVITSGVNFYNNERGKGVCCINNSIYIVGSNGNYPFITKLRINGTGYMPVATRWYNSGISTPSNFEKILPVSTNSIVIMGSINNSTYRNVLVKLDTNITATSVPIIARQSISNTTQFQNFTVNGVNTIVSGIYGSMPGVCVLDNNLNSIGCNTYSVSGIMSQIQYRNTNTYFTLSTGNTGSNLQLMKGNNVGATACSFTPSPLISFATISNSVLTTSLTVNTTYTIMIPFTYSTSITYTNTCITTDVKILSAEETTTKLLTLQNQYEVVSEDFDVNEVSVFDLTGKLILHNTNLRQNSVRVDLSQQGKGLYFIQIKLSNNQAKTFKVVNQ